MNMALEPGHAGVTQRIALNFRVAVLLPCHNEALSIRTVVADFSRALPHASIYVYDNCSSDNTADEARAAGAIVRNEPWAGKGNVVRRMFADIDADVYLMADGDGTYDAEVASVMVQRLIDEQLDMLVGTRMNIYEDAHRAGHAFGNRLFNGIYRTLFGPLFNDIFSGYRAFSHRFVKSFPAISSGFRNRDRDVGTRQPDPHAGGRNAYPLRCTPGRLGQQTAHRA